MKKIVIDNDTATLSDLFAYQQANAPHKIALAKLGCVYLPIDLDYPEQRINYIINDAEIKLLLTGRGRYGRLC